MERPIAHFRDDDLIDRCSQFAEGDQEQIVRERPRRLYSFERVVNRRGFGRADVNREQPSVAILLTEQHHGCIGWDFDADTDQFERDHAPDRTQSS